MSKHTRLYTSTFTLRFPILDTREVYELVKEQQALHLSLLLDCHEEGPCECPHEERQRLEDIVVYTKAIEVYTKQLEKLKVVYAKISNRPFEE